MFGIFGEIACFSLAFVVWRSSRFATVTFLEFRCIETEVKIDNGKRIDCSNTAKRQLLVWLNIVTFAQTLLGCARNSVFIPESTLKNPPKLSINAQAKEEGA